MLDRVIEGLLCDAVAYWYQKAGQTDPYKPVPIGERILPLPDLIYNHTNRLA